MRPTVARYVPEITLIEMLLSNRDLIEFILRDETEHHSVPTSRRSDRSYEERAADTSG